LIEECQHGHWRASAYVQLENGNETSEQTLGIEMVPDEEGARQWAHGNASALV
jgi:hypothetical protein